jgi:hypothetical protein
MLGPASRLGSRGSIALQIIAFARDCTFECRWDGKDFLAAVRTDGIQAAMATAVPQLLYPKPLLPGWHFPQENATLEGTGKGT